MHEYYKSINAEFEALQNRITYLIGNTHHATTGGYQESLLRSFLSKYLPDHIGVARGFVVFEQRHTLPHGNRWNDLNYNSNEIDILLYDKNRPVLYKDSSELVIVDVTSVKGVIEVKKNLTYHILDDTVKKLSANVKKINDLRNSDDKIFAGIFSYTASRYVIDNIFDKLNLYSNTNPNSVINHICLGNKHFIKFWKTDPAINNNLPYNLWHKYLFQDNLAMGYFIYNLITHFNNDLSTNIWFPHHSKELHIVETKSLINDSL